MKKQERDFKGVWIPAPLWLNPDLILIEKCLLVEIDSLDNERGCFASNSYLGKFMGLSENRISVMISKLEKLGFLTREVFDHHKRILRSNMHERCAPTQRGVLCTDKGGVCADTKGGVVSTQSLYIRNNNTKNNKGEDMPETSSGDKTKQNPEKSSSDQDKGSGKNGSGINMGIDSEFDKRKKTVTKYKMTDEGELKILKVYRSLIFTNCNASTTTLIEGIPRAIKMFTEYHKDPVKELIKSLRALSKNEWFSKKRLEERNYAIVSPKRVFSKKFIENVLLALSPNKPKNGSVSSRPKSAEELRQIEEDNGKRIEAFMARLNS